MYTRRLYLATALLTWSARLKSDETTIIIDKIYFIIDRCKRPFRDNISNLFIVFILSPNIYEPDTWCRPRIVLIPLSVYRICQIDRWKLKNLSDRFATPNIVVYLSYVFFTTGEKIKSRKKSILMETTLAYLCLQYSTLIQYWL